MLQRRETSRIRLLMAACAAAALGACSNSTESGASSSAAADAAPVAADTSWPTAADVVAEQNAFSAEGLAALDARMKEAVDKGEVAGLAQVLIKDGQVVDFDVWGNQAYNGPAMTEDTIFRIRSMTKPITGVAMMQLWEQGKWKPEDPITKFLPEMANLKVATSADNLDELAEPDHIPTMHELMTHTAGFGYSLSPRTAVERAFIEDNPMGQSDLDALVERTAEIPLLLQPGERWAYSIAVDLQGAVVERISGMSYGEYLDKNIFTPLGMDDTAFTLPEADRSRLATVYTRNNDTEEFDVLPDGYDFFVNDHAESGGGGLASTTHDYARFVQMLINEGELDGAQILKPETARFMMSNRIGDTPGVFTGGGFGYGGAVVTGEPSERSPQPIGTYSWFGIDGTWFWVDPVNDLGYVGMIQRRGGAGRGAINLRGESAQLVYEALND